MTPGSAEPSVPGGAGGPSPPPGPAPVLVLGLGNLLLCDDGLGLALLAELSPRAARWADRTEFVDGGTQGHLLVGRLEGRRGLLILDAVALGAAPGTVHVLEGNEVAASMPGGRLTAHGGNAGDLLRVAALLGEIPPDVTVVGIEPQIVKTGEGLSDAVLSAVPEAVESACAVLDRWCDL